MNRRGPKTAAFAAIAGIAIGGWFTIRSVTATRARHESECRALTKALDKTVRSRSPRVFEGIVEHRYDREAGRCLAALEYHYKPCDGTLLKKTPLLCTGPDADIAIYAFHDAGASPLFICERSYATGEARCTESVYGTDGSLLSSREFPPDQFPTIKAELISPKP
ncbi:MAG: hypothetical protein PHS14_20120 [Elusimicrobia bacterium]|nr:hypothetical protein [Elusimicrobiota bacterium]